MAEHVQPPSPLDPIAAPPPVVMPPLVSRQSSLTISTEPAAEPSAAAGTDDNKQPLAAQTKAIDEPVAGAQSAPQSSQAPSSKGKDVILAVGVNPREENPATGNSPSPQIKVVPLPAGPDNVSDTTKYTAPGAPEIIRDLNHSVRNIDPNHRRQPDKLEVITKFESSDCGTPQRASSPDCTLSSPVLLTSSTNVTEPATSPDGRNSPESLSTVDSWRVVAYLASRVDGAEMHGYIPKRKGEKPEQRAARKLWEKKHLTAAQRKQLRTAKREYKHKASRVQQMPPTCFDPSNTTAVSSKFVEHPAVAEQKAASSAVVEPVQSAELQPMDMDIPSEEPHNPAEQQQEEQPGAVGVAGFACCCLHRDGLLRTTAVKIVNSSWFDKIVLSVILLNCLTLALYDPLDEDCEKIKCKILYYCETSFNIIFFLEMIFKMVALGVWGEGCYMDNSWNRLDCAIVITSIVDFVPGQESSLSAFRAFRVLRPLRAINRFPNLRILVKLLLNTLPMLGSVAILFFILFFVLGVLAVQLWAGVLQQRCIDPSTNLVFDDPNDEPYVCTNPLHADETQHGANHCPPDDQPLYTQCSKDHGNPFYGTIGFDHLYLAWISLFQIVTLEGWVDIMYLVQDAYSFWCWPYFFGVVIFCSFFALNLCLVVISANFGQTKEDDIDEMKAVMQENASAVVAPASPDAATDGGLRESPTGRAGLEEEEEPAWRRKGRHLVSSDLFNGFVFVAIIINMLFMACEHHNQSELQTDIADIANKVLCWVFFAEMVIKLVVLGVKEYVADTFNVFDGIIVIVSLVEFFMAGGGALSVLRTFRLVRAVKLIRFIKSLQQQLAVILKTLSDMVAFFVMMLLFIFIFAILGMNLFGGKWDLDGVTPRKHFDNFGWALLTTFQVLTLEDWNVVEYDAVREGGLVTPLYFWALIVMGNFIILNLFVAILIGGFEDQGKETTNKKSPDSSDNEDEGAAKYKAAAESVLEPGTTVEIIKPVEGAVPIDSRKSIGRKIADAVIVRVQEPEDGTVWDNLSSVVYVVQLADSSERAVNRCELAVVDAPLSCLQTLRKRDLSVCIFSRNNAFRKCCLWMIARPEFEWIVMGAIIVNSGCLALERPAISDDSTERSVLDGMGYTFTAIFTVECLIKVIGLGFAFGPEGDAYLTVGWNRLDFFLVVSSAVYLGLEATGIGGWFKIIRVFRMLRTLRPLRMINKAPKLRATVDSLIKSLKPLGSTLIIIVFIFLIFGILGMELFSGLFYFCDGLTEEELETVDTKAQCLALGGTWANQTYTFDNIFESFLTLFVVASIDGWVEIMYLGIDVVGIDKQPKQDHSVQYCGFFVLFVMIGAFFSMNIFVGVVVENFQEARRQQAKREFSLIDFNDDGGLSRDEFQRVYGMVATETLFDKIDEDHSGHITPDEFEAARIGQQLQPLNLEGGEEEDTEPPLEQKMQTHFESLGEETCWPSVYQMVRSVEFEAFIMAVIGLNILMMGVEFYGQPDTMIEVIKWLNLTFTIIFILEAVVKLAAFGWVLYWADPWNAFDMFVVVISIVGTAFDMVGTDSIPVDPTALRLLRILRVARVLKMVKNAENLMVLLGGVRGAIPHVMNLLTLMLLVFFIFSAMGVELFSTILCDEDHPCHAISPLANFENFGMGTLTLFRIVTGDNWNGLFKDCLRTDPECNNSNDCEGAHANCCTAKYLSIPYFITFCVVTQLIMLNIVVAVLMEELESAIYAMNSPEIDASHLVDQKETKKRGEQDAETKTAVAIEGDGSAELKLTDAKTDSNFKKEPNP